MQPRFHFPVFLFLFAFVSSLFRAESKCRNGCDLALASYYVWEGSNLTYIAQIMQSNLLSESNLDLLLNLNKGKIPSKDSVQSQQRINVPFPCGCIKEQYLGHIFQYSLHSQDTYTKIATGNYSNLTTPQFLESTNTYRASNIPDSGTIDVTINCSCGVSEISRDYGLFITYPLRPEDSLQSIANETGVDEEWLQRYNPGVNFSQGSGLVYIPGKGNFIFFGNFGI